MALVGPSQAAVNLLNDPDFLQRQAQMIVARQAGLAIQNALVAARDQAAQSSNECTVLAESKKTAALDHMKRGQPPDPSRIIQNTTCFVDLASIKIPVALTGIGFLDGFINMFLSKMVNDSCNKLGTFIADLKSSALSQIANSTGASLSLSQINLTTIPVTIDGRTFNVEDTQLGTAALIAAGTTAAAQAVAQATANMPQSTYDTIHGTLPPNNSQQMIDQTNARIKQLQCEFNGIGANETCPCPTEPQSMYPQCSSYVPWW